MTDRKIVDYKILLPTKNNLKEFEDDIKNHIKEGWEILGNPAFAIQNYDQYICFQAMVKYEEDKSEIIKNEKSKITGLLKTLIKNVGFTERTKNVLLSENIHTIGDLKKLEYPYIINGMGKITQLEIFDFLMKFIARYEEK